MKYSERKLSQHKNSYFYRTPPVTASGSVENVFLVVSQNSQENIKKEKKETLAQVFSCEFCKIYRNTFFTEHLRATASAFIFSTSAFFLIRLSFEYFLKVPSRFIVCYLYLVFFNVIRIRQRTCHIFPFWCISSRLLVQTKTILVQKKLPTITHKVSETEPYFHVKQRKKV